MRNRKAARPGGDRNYPDVRARGGEGGIFHIAQGGGGVVIAHMVVVLSAMADGHYDFLGCSPERSILRVISHCCNIDKVLFTTQ